MELSGGEGLNFGDIVEFGEVDGHQVNVYFFEGSVHVAKCYEKVIFWDRS